MFFIQFAIVLLRVLIDTQIGDIGLGVLDGVGLAILAFGFRLEPTSLPIDVMLITMMVASAAVSIQASDDLGYMIRIATRVLHRNLEYITFTVPAVTCLFIVLAGTEHAAYSVLPVIAEVSRRNGIHPSRPLTMTVIVSQFAIVASPITAAVIACVTYLEPQHITVAGVLRVTVPSTIPGTDLACVFVNKLGKKLRDDPHYQKLLAKPEYVKAHERDPMEHINLTVGPRAKLSVGVFLAAALLMIIMGTVPELRPTFQTGEEPKLMGMTHTIEIIVLSVAALIILLCKPDGNIITRGSVSHTGIRAVIAVFGTAWFGGTLIHGHLMEIKDTVSHLVETASQTFAAVLFILSVLVNSQDTTVATLFPIATSLNTPVPVTIGTFAAVNGYFFTPNHGPIIAAIDLDSTGSTKIGKYIFSHSFMIPGLLNLVFSLIFGLTFAEAPPRT